MDPNAEYVNTLHRTYKSNHKDKEKEKYSEREKNKETTLNREGNKMKKDEKKKSIGSNGNIAKGEFKNRVEDEIIDITDICPENGNKNYSKIVNIVSDNNGKNNDNNVNIDNRDNNIINVHNKKDMNMESENTTTSSTCFTRTYSKIKKSSSCSSSVSSKDRKSVV